MSADNYYGMEPEEFYSTIDVGVVPDADEFYAAELGMTVEELAECF